jgi:striatin 1/3/4
MTLRGHSGGVTTVLISPSHIYSASFDSTIKSWSIPPIPGPPYMPYDSSINDATLVGHSDVVWGLTMLPNEVLGSAGADGTIKIWDLKRTEDNPLMRSWGYDGVSEGNGRAVKKKKKVVPTALIGVGDKVVVAYADAVVKVFGVESGKEVLRMKSAETYGEFHLALGSAQGLTSGNRWNDRVSDQRCCRSSYAAYHRDGSRRQMDPTLLQHDWYIPLSSFLRSLLTVQTGECTHSILAHLDGVTSLSFSPSGTSLVSVGHDLSIRFWDIKNLSCEAEIESHKVKGSEGILDVKWGKEGVVTAGADGVVKVWGT